MSFPYWTKKVSSQGPSENNLKRKGKICETRGHGDAIKSTQVRANAREPQ